MTCGYVACCFGSVGQGRKYTYHYDADALTLLPGDRVRVLSKTGGALATLVVDHIVDHAPTFPTKPIIDKAPPPEEAKELEPA